MPYKDAPNSKRFFGWYRDMVNNTLELYDGAATKIATASTAVFATTGSTTSTTTVIAGTDLRSTAGNVRLGTVSTFATTEPVSAVVMKTGTAPSGAITTSGGIFTDGTTVKKIIADGTVSDVQT